MLQVFLKFKEAFQFRSLRVPKSSRVDERHIDVVGRSEVANEILLDALLDAIAVNSTDLASSFSDAISRRMLSTENPAHQQVRNYRKLLDGDRLSKIEETVAPAQKSKRYSERRRQILEAALESFGDRGTEISLQGLSQQLKVSQPLIHRYFPAKADLLAAIKDALQTDHWSEGFARGLRDRSVSIEQRLANFYAAYLPSTSRRRWIRSFEFAALSDESFAQSYLGRVENEVISTIAHEARATLGYPENSDYTPSSRELEAAWGMHSAIMLWVSRKYAYKTLTIDAVEVLVSDQIFAYLALAKRIQLELYGEA